MKHELLTSPSIARAPSRAASGIVLGEGRIVLVSGQVAWDANGEVVGVGDVERQTRQAFKNLRDVLALGGATLSDVVKYNFYLTDLGSRQSVLAVRREVLGETQPPSTTVIVSSLVEPELLIEIDAIVVM